MTGTYADQRAHDVAWMTAAERAELDTGSASQPETHVVGRTVLARFNPEDRSFAAPASWLGVAIRSTDRWEVLGINDTGAAVIRQLAGSRTVASIYPGQYRMA